MVGRSVARRWNWRGRVCVCACVWERVGRERERKGETGSSGGVCLSSQRRREVKAAASYVSLPSPTCTPRACIRLGRRESGRERENESDVRVWSSSLRCARCFAPSSAAWQPVQRTCVRAALCLFIVERKGRRAQRGSWVGTLADLGGCGVVVAAPLSTLALGVLACHRAGARMCYC